MKYISRILRTGAVRKTPEKIIQRILTEINPNDDAHILEFGAGNGEISQPLARSLTRHNISYFAFAVFLGGERAVRTPQCPCNGFFE